MLDNFSNWIDYLMANPLIGIVVVVILILFIIMVLSRLFKWALVAFILLVVAIAVTYRVSQPKDIIKKMQEGIENIREGVQKGQNEVKKVGKEVQKGAKELEKRVPK